RLSPRAYTQGLKPVQTSSVSLAGGRILHERRAECVKEALLQLIQVAVRNGKILFNIGQQRGRFQAVRVFATLAEPDTPVEIVGAGQILFLVVHQRSQKPKYVPRWRSYKLQPRGDAAIPVGISH